MLSHPPSTDRFIVFELALALAALRCAGLQVAKRSDRKDVLLKGGASLIRTRGKAFQVTSLACGARHTLALTSSQEIFTWGSGCCGQLGHGSRHDELLPRPLQGLHKTKDLRAHAIAAGAYHSAAIIGEHTPCGMQTLQRRPAAR